MLCKLRQVDEVDALLVVYVNLVDSFRVELLQTSWGEPTDVRIENYWVARLPVVRDRQVVLLVDLKMLHNEDAVAHESMLVARQDQVFAEHFVGH